MTWNGDIDWRILRMKISKWAPTQPPTPTHLDHICDGWVKAEMCLTNGGAWLVKGKWLGWTEMASPCTYTLMGEKWQTIKGGIQLQTNTLAACIDGKGWDWCYYDWSERQERREYQYKTSWNWMNMLVSRRNSSDQGVVNTGNEGSVGSVNGGGGVGVGVGKCDCASGERGQDCSLKRDMAGSYGFRGRLW